jgi:hypothetical protein
MPDVQYAATEIARLAVLADGAKAMYEFFAAYTAAGFTEAQALVLLGEAMRSQKRNEHA